MKKGPPYFGHSPRQFVAPHYERIYLMRRTTLVLSILASAATLGACGGQKVRGSAMSTYAEGRISTQIQGAKADCPDTDYKQGATVDCPVDVQGKKFVASLKMQGKQDDKVLLSFLKFEPAK